MCSLSSEAAAYWRGLQAQAQGSGLEVLAACRSVDAGVVRRPLGAAGAGGREARVAELLGRMQEACKVGGRGGVLRGEGACVLGGGMGAGVGELMGRMQEACKVGCVGTGDVCIWGMGWVCITGRSGVGWGWGVRVGVGW